MNGLAERVRRFVDAHRLWGPRDRVVLAVSGGLDSMVLLDLFGRDGVIVATVDHGVRAGSAGDADRVAAIASARGLAVVRIALAMGSASEAEMRDARRAALDPLGDVVALAHHRDDQVETVLINLMRGTGGGGLGGMRPKNGKFVRPLLEEGRSDLLAYARHRGLRWFEDPSNQSPEFLRNRVRHELVPLLEQIRSGAGAAIARSAALQAEDEELLRAMVTEQPPWPNEWLATAPMPIVRRALRIAIPEATTVHHELIREAARSGRAAVALPGGAELRNTDGSWARHPARKS